MAAPKVLVVDDEETIRFAVREFLRSQGLEVLEAETCRQAEEFFRSGRPDAVVMDYRLPDGTALDLLPRLRSVDSGVPVSVLTGHGTIDLAVQAIKLGADQFLTKPVELPALGILLERQLASRRVRKKDLATQAREARRAIDPFVGTSAVIRSLAEDARRVAAVESPVLIRGDTGVGKGVLARWLHANGPRAEEAFVDLNCAGLSREFLETELFGHEKGAFTGAAAAKSGLLEIAHRGTVFLDEVGDIDPQVQPKLLKVLEEKCFRRLGSVHDRHVDVRLLSATHQDLGELVREHRFRSDLYFRINTVTLVVPPLRERAEDVPLLARLLLDAVASELGRGHVALAPEAEAALSAYPWPGNVRELRNLLERTLLLSDRSTLMARDLSFELDLQPRAALGPSLTLAELERRHIERVLGEAGGSVAIAAQRLGIPRSSLYQKIKTMGLATGR